MRSRSALDLDQLRPLKTLGAQFLGLALTLGFHAVVDGLAGFERQVRAMQPDFGDFDAVGREFGAHLGAGFLHDIWRGRGERRVGRLIRPNSRRIAVLITWDNWARASVRLCRLW